MSEVSDLMSRDPLSLTREDRTAIIAYFRENRIRFLAGNKAAGKPAKPAKIEAVKGPKKEAVEIELELDL